MSIYIYNTHVSNCEYICILLAAKPAIKINRQHQKCAMIKSWAAWGMVIHPIWKWNEMDGFF